MPKLVTTEDFIARSRVKHGEKFDYSRVVYRAAHHKFARTGTTLDERTCSGRISRRRHTRHKAPLASLEELKRCFKKRLVKAANGDSPCS